jgi:hypothetical protein
MILLIISSIVGNGMNKQQERRNTAMSNNNSMNPMTGDTVETDGIYANEYGQEVTLKRGDEFPADLILGRTAWELQGFANEAEIDHNQTENHPLRKRVQTRT